MTLQCSLCGEFFKSLILVPEQAINEVSEKLIQHLQTNHQKEAKELIQDHLVLSSILVWYLTMQRFAKWSSEEEKFIEKNFRQWEMRIGELVGMTPKIDSKDLKLVIQ